MLLGVASVPAFAFGNSDITNQSWKQSNGVGKKYKSRSTVKDIALDKQAWRVILHSGDCGRDPGKWNDCEQDRARSEWTSQTSIKKGESWHSVSMFLPEDHMSVSPVLNVYFQLHQKHAGQILFIQDVGENIYISFHSGGGFGGDPKNKITHHKQIVVDEYKGKKWMNFVIHLNASRDYDGFMKVYLNGELYSEYHGKTMHNNQTLFSKFGIYHAYRSLHDKSSKGVYPDQVVYYDNLYQAKTKEKLLKLIQK